MGNGIRGRRLGAPMAALSVALMASGAASAAPPGAATSAAQVAARPAGAAAWPAVANRFIESYFEAQPFFAAQSGRHEFDGKMPDYSAAGIKFEIRRLHAARRDVEAVDPAGLSAAEQLDRAILLNVVDRDLFQMEKAQFPFRNPAWYLNNIDPDVYLSRDYAPLERRLRGYLGYARSIPGIARAIRANLRTPLPKSFVDYGVKAFGGMAQFYRADVGRVFAPVADPQLQRQLASADAAAARAMEDLKDWFAAQRNSADDSFALGKDLFSQMVKDTEQVDVPIERIEALGQADLERNTRALALECGRFAPQAALAACVAKMSADKPGASVIDAARAQLRELKTFVQTKNIVSIPGDQQARVALAPPYNRANFAFIQIPGPYDRGVASVYNIAPPDPAWPEAEQRAYIPGRDTLLITSAHEVWPGHFLQFLHANSNPSKVEALWVGYAFAEGWAHYCEQMMIDEGLGAGDPQVHIAQLVDALLRDVRLLSAIGLHTRGMSIAASEAMFREKAFQDPGNARQQAARGSYDPAYLNYALGKWMIMKLRSDWIAAKAPAPAVDPKTLWRAFHDQFLSYGGPPIPLVRRQMLGEAGAVL